MYIFWKRSCFKSPAKIALNARCARSTPNIIIYTHIIRKRYYIDEREIVKFMSRNFIMARIYIVPVYNVHHIRTCIRHFHGKGFSHLTAVYIVRTAFYSSELFPGVYFYYIPLNFRAEISDVMCDSRGTTTAMHAGCHITESYFARKAKI